MGIGIEFKHHTRGWPTFEWNIKRDDDGGYSRKRSTAAAKMNPSAVFILWCSGELKGQLTGVKMTEQREPQQWD